MKEEIREVLNSKRVRDLFKEYNIIYNDEQGIIKIDGEIKTIDFIRLKKVLPLLNIPINDIRIGRDVYAKISQSWRLLAS